MSRKSKPKLHYIRPWDGSKVLCGKPVTGELGVTSNPYEVTCSGCKNSRHLDGALGNMTHPGH